MDMDMELRQRVKEYIENNTEGEFYPEDLSRKLDIDFQEVLNICQGLILEGFIEIASWKVETLKKTNKK